VGIIALKNNKTHQGKFHLLVIFAIPTLMVSIFLAERWWIPVSVISVILVSVYFLFFRKGKER
jgi:hypothetical protein